MKQFDRWTDTHRTHKYSRTYIGNSIKLLKTVRESQTLSEIHTDTHRYSTQTYPQTDIQTPIDTHSYSWIPPDNHRQSQALTDSHRYH